MRLIILALALGVCLFGSIAEETLADFTPDTYYVSPQGGSDTNPATRERPLATIQKALDLASQSGSKDGSIVYLQRGTYFLTEPLRVNVTNELCIRGEGSYDRPPEATISGGRVITGFTEIEPGLVVADVPEVKAGNWDFRDLYVNDHRAIRAREPNTGYFRVEKAGEDRRTNFIYNEGDLKKWKDLENVELVFLHDWSITRCPIKEIDEAERRLTVPHQIGCHLDFFTIDNWEPHPRYFVENSIEFLDAPGEWFLDTKEGKLFYRLKEGESADTLEVIAPVLTQLLVAEGTAEQKIELSLHCIRFAHSAYFPKPENTVWETQAAAFMTPGGPQSSQFLPSPAAVQIEFADLVSVVNCAFEHLGENGLWISRGSSRGFISYSRFRDIGANAIMIGTHHHENIADENIVENITVQGTLVEKAGETLYGAVGIWVGFGRNIDIHDNIVRRLPYGGISLGWQWNPDPTPARDNKIRNNLIYDCIQILSDSGGIYTLGYQPNSLIEGNVIHSIPRAQGNAESNGMFLDEGTQGFIIRNNRIFNTEQSSLRFHRAGTNIVRENILLNRPGVPMIRFNSTPERNIDHLLNRDMDGNVYGSASAVR